MKEPPFQISQRTFLLASFRLVQWCTLFALSWKIGAFVQMARCYVTTPLYQDFFPAFFESTWVLVADYLFLLVCLAISAMTSRKHVRVGTSLGSLTLVSLLCVHQGSYNDMTFATAWWTSLWSCWVAWRIDVDDDAELLRKAAIVSRSVIAMILLGGAVGKWTSEYWSGQVLYEIYFIDRDFWFFNLLRQSLDQETLRSVATGYSRMVIVSETVCGLSLFWLPPRVAAALAMIVLTSIAMLSNFNLFSVLLSLIGLAAVGLFVPRKRKLVASLDMLK